MKSFNQIHNDRRNFIKINNKRDHIILRGKNNVVISSPHGVSQVRLGRLKTKEPGSLASAIYLSSETNSFLIAKTKNNYDDANFDESSSYKKDLLKCIRDNGIKYVIDFHGLSEKREMDINLGTHLGLNVSSNEEVFQCLYDELLKHNFKVTIDQPFMGGGNTIAGFVKKNISDIFSLQVEINCAITNRKENYDKFCVLLKILTNWINNLK